MLIFSYLNFKQAVNNLKLPTFLKLLPMYLCFLPKEKNARKGHFAK
jgi:hypothetical protein